MIEQITRTNGIEFLAFLLSVIYVVLASKKNNWCWIFGIISSFLYVIICFQFQLYFDSILQVFYVFMGVFGWLNWKKINNLTIQKYNFSFHFKFIILLIIFCILLGYISQLFTNQFYPFLDAFIFVFSLFATYLLTKQILENWLYFVFIDLIAIFIFWQRELYLTSLLYLIYTFTAVYGYYNWIKLKRETSTN